MLKASNLHKIYNNAGKTIHVLKGINLDIGKGKIVAIVGPSGAGKSTLLHLLAGLDEPSGGEVNLDGLDIYKLSDQELAQLRNRKIGFVFQFYHLLSELTVLENIILPAMVPLNQSGRQFRKEAGELLGRTGLGERQGHFPNQLSGGEQQRVAICRSLINHPEILFCDEPTGNLDSATGQEIINLIRELNSKTQMTVVLVTHNRELADIADEIFYLKDGLLMN